MIALIHCAGLSQFPDREFLRFVVLNQTRATLATIEAVEAWFPSPQKTAPTPEGSHAFLLQLSMFSCSFSTSGRHGLWTQ